MLIVVRFFSCLSMGISRIFSKHPGSIFQAKFIAFLLSLLLVILIVYHEALVTPLNSDAQLLSYRNRFVIQPGMWKKFWISGFFDGAQTGTEFVQVSGYYRPVTNMLFWFIYRLSADAPFLYNLTQQLIHWLNAGLIFLIATSLFSAPFLAAALSAALFAIHPINAFAATNPAALSDVLFLFMYLCSFLVYSRTILFLKGRSFMAGIAASLILFTLSVLSKEMGVTLPALLVLLHLYWFQTSKVPIKQAIWTTPFWAVCSLYFVWRFSVLELPEHSLGYTDVYSPLVVYLNLFKHLPIYLSRILLPHGADYPELVPAFINFVDEKLTSPLIYLSLALLCVLLLSIVILRNRHPFQAFLIAWFLITFSPILAVNKISGSLGLNVIIAQERWVYLPGIGLFLLLGHMGYRLYHRTKSNQPARWIMVAGILILYAQLGHMAAIHASNVESWYAILRQYYLIPEEKLSRLDRVNKLILYSNLVALPMGHQEIAEARSRQAVDLAPDSPIAALALANALAAAGKWDQVVKELSAWMSPSKDWILEKHKTNFRVIDDLHRSHGAIAYLLGRALAYTGKGKLAVSALCKALNRHVNRQAIAAALHEVYALNGPSQCIHAENPTECVAALPEPNIKEWEKFLDSNLCETWHDLLGEQF